MIDKLSLLQDLSLRYVIDFFKNESARTTYTKNKKNLKNNDIFLSSYPRSGNTWMRLMLADCLLQASGIPTQTDLPVSLSQEQTAIEDELLPETVQLIESKGKSLYDRAKQLELKDIELSYQNRYKNSQVYEV